MTARRKAIDRLRRRRRLGGGEAADAALADLDPSPVVALNRAVAVAMADGPRAGLSLLEPLLASGVLADYAPLHAAHADLLSLTGDGAAAELAWRRAGEPSANAVQRRWLLDRVEAQR